MDQKTEYVEKLSAQLVEWDAQIDLLKYKADSATGEEKLVLEREIAALLQKHKEVELKLQGISASSDDTWEDVKAETENIADQMKSSLRDAIIKIK